MPDEGFLRRWARLKADGPAVAEPAPGPAEPRAQAPAPVVVPQSPPVDADSAPVLPTLADVARLDANSDFSAFVTRGVDKDVRRLAMKKLFSDPHFNLVDKLDVYMDDYNKPSPMSAEMLAALHHTKNLFAPLAADKEAEPDEAAGEPKAPTAAQADGDATDADHDITLAQPEPLPFDVAAPSDVLRQTQQGKA